jgi:hypothetical protein
MQVGVIGMTTKKPTDLKIRRAKRKLKVARPEVFKKEPWYASAAMRIGIKTGDDKSPRS